MTAETQELVKAIEEAVGIAAQADEASIALLATAESFTIGTTDQYNESSTLLRTLKAKQHQINELRLSVTRPMDEAKSRVMGLFKPATDRLSRAEAAIKQAMLTFTREQERQRREQQAKLDEQARVEREKLERAAEKERERLRKLAEANREKGKEQRAEAFEERAAQVEVPIVSAPIIADDMPKTEGIAYRTTWKAEVTDKLALVKAVAVGEQPLSLLEANMSTLHAYARELKDKFAIPGVQAVSEDIIAARS